MKIDIYDFDKTIVPYDSAITFYKWCLIHYPKTIILIPAQFVWALLACLKIISLQKFKKYCFNFIKFINTEEAVKKFWDSHEKDVFPFIKKGSRKSDNKVAIISASPEFLIKEIASRLDVEYCIATKHDEKTGIIQEKICRKERKVEKFNELNLDAEVENVFSDNKKNDRPIFLLGEHCYLAKKGTLTEITIK